MAASDGLITVSSFEKDSEIYARTSFPSKIASYVNTGVPVICWGPEYSVPAVFSNKHGMLVFSESSPYNFLEFLVAEAGLHDLPLGAKAEFSKTAIQSVFLKKL